MILLQGMKIKISWGTSQNYNSSSNKRKENNEEKEIHVKPLNEYKRKVIDLLAEYVSKLGSAIEDHILPKIKDSNDFSFLNDQDSPEYQYYRWRVYSLCNGDSLYNWNVEPFQMFVDGPKWFPPTYKDLGMY